MIQRHTCVSVHCDQCGDALGSPEFEAHYRTERAALRAAPPLCQALVRQFGASGSQQRA